MVLNNLITIKYFDYSYSFKGTSLIYTYRTRVAMLKSKVASLSLAFV